MHISKLTIRNYRNFLASCLNFHKGVNTIIGENGSGKTNIMQAIRILLDENLPRTYRLYESDFNRSLLNWRGHWIIIQLFFDDLDHGDEAQALALHQIGDAAPDNTKGSCAIIFRPKYIVRKSLYDLSIDEAKSPEKLAAIRDAINIDDYEMLYTAKTTIDFSTNKAYKQYIGDFRRIVFPDPSDLAQDIYGSKLYIGNLTKEVSCTFVKALRDVEADLRSYRDNPLINLLRGKEKTIEIAKKKDIVKRIQTLNEEISDLDEVRDVSQGISTSIKTSVGETYAPGISIKSELPEDMEKLMQSLKLWVGDSVDEPYLGRIWELSLGGANLIYLSTKLLEFEKVKSLDKVANFLLIEEPEAHIHTHIQKTLFQKIPGLNTQVIITTHSTHISSVCKISAMNVLSKSANLVKVFDPSNGLNEDEISRIERYLDAIRSTLLFAKGVILVEGDAEQILIPALIRAVFGISLDEIGVSLINIGSTGFQNLATIFHQDRVNKYCAILTDLDKSILKLPEDLSDDTDEQRDCRNSELKGEERRIILDEFISENDYVDVFYADNTFEVQFLQAGNEAPVINLIKDQYKKKADVVAITEKINESEIEMYGKEILRLANKFGKGWFALLLSEYLDHKSKIPRYILKALSFAVPTLGVETIKSICSKRLLALHNDPFEDDETDYKSLMRSIAKKTTRKEIADEMNEHMPDDDLSNFLAI
ncbi:MAG: AAA family ATPase [Bacteroidota bacterium]